jgi:DNA polymerase I-like protein with 3'-5' exonuclease and polymerase domains
LNWQGLPGKDETLLKHIAHLYKLTKEDDIKANLWGFDSKFVGPYAEQDAAGTLALAGKLRPFLAEENLETAYQVERDLLPITLKMKQRGIRINEERARKLTKQIKERCEDELFELSKNLVQKVTIKEIRSNHWLQDQFYKLDLVFPMTSPSELYNEGQASFEKSFMSNHPHWFPRAVFKIKHQYDLADKFLQKFIIDHAYKGRVYPTVNQFRSEWGGARSHRFSYSNPALQQMPSRDDEWAPLIRSCFIPEEGEEWCSIDYRQQEYRLIVFVAELLRKRGASQAAERYRTDPNTDFHDYVAKITRLQRRRAKDCNFAKAYGAGKKKFALMTGMDEDEAGRVMDQYDEELPFVRLIAEHYSRFASAKGYIKMIDGARNHFNLWEPVYRDFAKEYSYKKMHNKAVTPCFEIEFEQYRNDETHPWWGERGKRSFTHKAFNRMIQGSAARQIKKAMVDIAKAGYHSLLQIHDELGLSFSNREDGYKCAKLMEEAMPVITIPMTTDVKFGASWGEVK